MSNYAFQLDQLIFSPGIPKEFNKTPTYSPILLKQHCIRTHFANWKLQIVTCEDPFRQLKFINSCSWGPISPITLKIITLDDTFRLENYVSLYKQPGFAKFLIYHLKIPWNFPNMESWIDINTIESVIYSYTFCSILRFYFSIRKLAKAENVDLKGEWSFLHSVISYNNKFSLSLFHSCFNKVNLRIKLWSFEVFETSDPSSRKMTKKDLQLNKVNHQPSRGIKKLWKFRASRQSYKNLRTSD